MRTLKLWNNFPLLRCILLYHSCNIGDIICGEFHGSYRPHIQNSVHSYLPLFNFKIYNKLTQHMCIIKIETYKYMNNQNYMDVIKLY